MKCPTFGAPISCSPVDRPFMLVPKMCSWQRLLVSSTSTRGLSNGASPVYELRTYSLVPSKVKTDIFLLECDFLTAFVTRWVPLWHWARKSSTCGLNIPSCLATGLWNWEGWTRWARGGLVWFPNWLRSVGWEIWLGADTAPPTGTCTKHGVEMMLVGIRW